jgi:hypothetical protein
MTQDHPLVARLIALAESYARAEAAVDIPTGDLYRGVALRQRNESRAALRDALQSALAAQPAPTKTYCCYGKYADAGHDDDCPTKAKAAPTEQAQPIVAWEHHYRRIGGGDRYCLANLGDEHSGTAVGGQEPKDGYEWYRAEPLTYARRVEQAQPVVGETWLVKHKGASALTTMTFAQVTPNTVQLQADYWQADGMRYAKDDLEFVERLATPPTAQPAESERKTS